MSRPLTASDPGQVDRPGQLRTIADLARLLQHFESTNKPVHPEQYQHVVARMSALLAEEAGDDSLRSILSAYPAAGELYENLRYEQAGLCLHDLDMATTSEQAARRVLDTIRAR